jgi:hypothetical protein
MDDLWCQRLYRAPCGCRGEAPGPIPQIERKLVGREHSEKVEDLERDTWNALQSYVAATAFALAIDGVE